MDKKKERSLTLKEHQAIMLDMMIAFDRYCKTNGLRYFMAGGTLLGAVRHKGFIPWDDDVDIVMPRPDYEKLISDEKISDDYLIVSLYNQHGYYHPFAYCNITDKNTILRENNIVKQTGKGIFLDIFPLDGVPENKIKQSLHFRRLSFIQSIFSNTIIPAPGFNGLKCSIKTIIHAMCLPLNPNTLGMKIDKLAQKYPYDTSNYLMHYVYLPRSLKYIAFDSSEYARSKGYEFEGAIIQGPEDADKVLKRGFGNTYMQLPPLDQREGHHGIEIYYR